MTALWRSVTYNYREGGALQLARKLGGRLRSWLWSETAWLVYTVDLSDYQDEPKLPLVRREMGLDELKEQGYFKVIAFPEVVRRRLAAGEQCHGFFLGGELVNIAWTTRDKLVLETRVWSINRERSMGIYDCYTAPAHRGKGIYTDTLVRLLGSAREQGVMTALIAVDPANRPSIKAIERSGFRPLHHLTRRRRAGRSSIQKSQFPPVFGETTTGGKT
jgi:RimJ/RimL family protein N-acetyltransferase